MDSGKYVCYLLDYKIGTWWNCDDDTITYYSGCPDNINNNLSDKNEEKRGKFYYECIRYDCVNVIQKRDILASST